MIARKLDSVRLNHRGTALALDRVPPIDRIWPSCHATIAGGNPASAVETAANGPITATHRNARNSTQERK